MFLEPSKATLMFTTDPCDQLRIHGDAISHAVAFGNIATCNSLPLAHAGTAAKAGTVTDLVLNEKRGQVVPYDLATEPDIAAVLSSIDTAELGAEPPSVGG